MSLILCIETGTDVCSVALSKDGRPVSLREEAGREHARNVAVFTEELFRRLEEKGVEILDVTLHIGLGTFRPVKEDDIRKHDMHSEFYIMDEKTAERLNLAKREKRRIIAIGTTSTRTLESVYQRFGTFRACSGDTKLFIYPGFQYQAIDCLITNFHLPKSTLLMLVSAFSSRDHILHAYRHAVEKGYRFFSFGDAMFITREK